MNKIHFLEQNWFWPVLIAALLIWLVFLWKELKIPNNKKRILNGAIAFIGITALVLMILQPVIRKRSDSGYAVLLTEAYSKNQLDSLNKTIKGIKKVKYIHNMPLQELEAFEKLIILGNGIPTYEINRFKKFNVQYLRNNFPEGIHRLHYNARAEIGSILKVEGLYEGTSPGHWLTLLDPGGSPVDSVKLPDISTATFTLRTPLKTLGNYSYAISEKDSLGKILKTDPIPVTISEKILPRILIINAYPSFETKYLKNYLADRSCEVLVKTRVSKDKYKTEAFNSGGSIAGKSIAKLLEDTDLLIIDLASLKDWSSTMTQTLKNQILNKGLGIIIQADDDLCGSRDDWFCFSANNDGKETIVPDQYPETAIQKYPVSIRSENGIFPVLTSGNSIVAAYRKKGLGRVGITTIRDSYELILKGNENSYQQFWSTFLESVSKRKDINTQWDSDAISYQDEPFTFTVSTSIENPVILLDSVVRIPILYDHTGTGITYPETPGWHDLQVQQDSSSVYNFYTYREENWKTMKTYEQIKRNQAQFNSNSNSVNQVYYSQPWTPIWFFLVFLFCMGYLWLQPKLLNS
ncbi:hypothetical protein [Robertkochia solimangrovi]|uniref:hypothetical protein n=1 Tax=Robertkochia solimangrovi TaxID=2213046 RepID=UPI00117EF805|nr:hypothetical protein [Robertkochia solimangrovi]TRZ43173.1 hypothetical protein DMZ48_10800 [Robertkochia solimangrovi]